MKIITLCANNWAAVQKRFRILKRIIVIFPNKNRAHSELMLQIALFSVFLQQDSLRFTKKTITHAKFH